MNKLKLKIVMIALASLITIGGTGIFIAQKNTSNTVLQNISQLLDSFSVGIQALMDLDYEAAIIAFNNAIALDPNNPNLYIDIANAFINVQDYFTACIYLEEGYRITKNNAINDLYIPLKAIKYSSDYSVTFTGYTDDNRSVISATPIGSLWTICIFSFHGIRPGFYRRRFDRTFIKI